MALRVYVSPHLDDAVFSCGGLIARQKARGDEVVVITVCGGDPPMGELTPFAYDLHRRWGGEGSPMGLRRAEDHVACGRLGASVVHLPIPDAIYRRSAQGEAFYPDNGSLFGAMAAGDSGRIDEAAAALERAVPPESEIYLPLGIGGHVDHLLTRRAAERLVHPRWYYRDLPYALGDPPRVTVNPPEHATEASITLAEEEIEIWIAAAGEYHSQLSSFWPDYESLEADLRSFHDHFAGIPLLRAAAS